MIVVFQVFFRSTHLRYTGHVTPIQHQPDRPVYVHLLVCLSSYIFVQWEHVCVCCPLLCLFRWLRSSHCGVGTWWAEPASGQKRRNCGCQLSDRTLCIHLHHQRWHTYTHTHTQTCGLKSDTARRRNKLRQSKIGLPQIVLSFCIISASERRDWGTCCRRDRWHRQGKQKRSRCDRRGCRVSVRRLKKI